MCASHRNLRDMMPRRQFREDLYYRVNGIMELPPLALRADKEALIHKCIARESAVGARVSIEAAALKRLLAYPWPGNIRELRNAIRTAIAICDDQVIRVGDLPEDIKPHPSLPVNRIVGEAASKNVSVDHKISLQAAERDALVRAIEKSRGHMTDVAAQLGISRNTLYRKIKSPPAFKSRAGPKSLDPRAAAGRNLRSENGETRSRYCMMMRIHRFTFGANTMPFQLIGVPFDPFAPLFLLTDRELAELDAQRVVAAENPGYPCRVSLADAEVGEELLLVPFAHQPARTPYKASGPIFVRKSARQRKLAAGVIPDYVRLRQMSVRAYDAAHLMIDAAVCEGEDAAATILAMFDNSDAAYIHLHNAKRGCFSCRVNRA